MSGQKWLIAIIVALIAAGGLFFLVRDENPSTLNTSSTSTNTSQSTPNENPGNESTSSTTERQITTAEVATHKSASDCWTIINNNVYDLTSFIAEHPGGDEILRACGNDASTLFNQRETSEGEEIGSGTPHSSSARSQLAQLQIGVLAE